MAGGSAAFWKGVRCWQFAKCLRVQPAASGIQPKIGAGRRRARLSTRSPNFAYQIVVPCWMAAVSGDHAKSVAALTGAGRQVTRQIYVSKTLEMFMEQSGGAYGPGDLAWVEDIDDVLPVGLAAGGGEDVVVTYTPGTYAPAVGDLVLFRNPADGSGFVTTITGHVGSPTYTMTVDLQRPTAERDETTGEFILQDVDITTDWEILRVSYYYPSCVFQSMNDAEVPSQVEDKWVQNISYQFMAEKGIVYPAAMTPDFAT